MTPSESSIRIMANAAQLAEMAATMRAATQTMDQADAAQLAELRAVLPPLVKALRCLIQSASQAAEAADQMQQTANALATGGLN